MSYRDDIAERRLHLSRKLDEVEACCERAVLAFDDGHRADAVLDLAEAQRLEAEHFPHELGLVSEGLARELGLADEVEALLDVVPSCPVWDDESRSPL